LKRDQKNKVQRVKKRAEMKERRRKDPEGQYSN
jgi:hypothetical protein